MRTKIDVRTRKNLRETVNFFGNTDETDENIDKWQGAGKHYNMFPDNSESRTEPTYGSVGQFLIRFS